MPKKTYTVKEVANLLGFSTNTVYKYLDEGKIKSTRLGKEGRFRIPASQVSKLLQVTKDVDTLQGEVVPTENPPEKSSFIPEPGHYGAPSLFDWFIGFLSMGLGFSQFIFPAYALTIQASSLTVPLHILHFLLFVGGFFLVLSDVYKFKAKVWHKAIHFALGFLYLIVTGILVYLGAAPEGVGYLAASVIIILTAAGKLNDYTRFVLFLNFLMAFLGLAVIFWPKAFFLATFISPNLVNLIIFFVLWLIGEIVLVYISIRGIKGSSHYIKILAFVVAIFALIYSTFAFTNGFWGRAIYCVILASFSVMFPFSSHFDSLTIRSKKETIFGFGWLFVLLFVGSIVLYFIYSSFEKYIFNELTNRVNSANEVLATFVSGNEVKISSFANDIEVVDLMREGNFDLKKADSQLRQLYLMANGSLRRVVLVDRKGIIRDTYPFNLSSQDLDISGRDYFRSPALTREIIVTGITQPSSPGIPPAVLVAVPIIDSDGTFLGTLEGSTDLAELTRRITQVQFGEKGHYLLTDSNKNYIIPPTPDKIMTTASGDSFPAMAVEGKSGVGRTYDDSGLLSFAAYRQATKYNWGIVTEEPLSEVFRTYSITGFVVYLVFLMSGVGSIVLTAYLRKKRG